MHNAYHILAMQQQKTDKRKEKDYYSRIGADGGRARALALSHRKRRKIAQKAAQKRWRKEPET